MQNNLGFPKNYLRQRSYLRPPKIPTTPNSLALQKPTADLKCQPCFRRPPTWARCRSGARTVPLKRRSLLSPRANPKGEAGGRCDGMSSSRPLSFHASPKEWSTSCLLSRCHGACFFFSTIWTPTGLLYEISTEAAEEHPLSLLKCQWLGVNRLWNQWWRNGRMLSGGGRGGLLLMFRLCAPHAGNFAALFRPSESH